MHNLVGIATHSANKQASLELQTANITVFSGNRMADREVRTTVCGVMQFADGRLAVLERCYYYWCVKLAPELDTSFVRMLERESRGSILDVISSIDIYHQDGLNLLAKCLKHCSPEVSLTKMAEAQAMTHGLRQLAVWR